MTSTTDYAVRCIDALRLESMPQHVTWAAMLASWNVGDYIEQCLAETAYTGRECDCPAARVAQAEHDTECGYRIDAVSAGFFELVAQVSAEVARLWQFCRTCGNPIEADGRGVGTCLCWCNLAGALQQYLGRDFDGSAQDAADMWRALDHADRARVWNADYPRECVGVRWYPAPGVAKEND